METLDGLRVPRGAVADDRLDGWKSIANYFGRDRTTVIRWTRERGLPVHRLPGGRIGTIYALKRELDHWVAGGGAEADVPEAAPVAPVPAARRVPRAAVIAMCLAVLATPFALWRASSPVSAAVEQAPPAPVASRFLAARDLVADRDALGIERGIALLEQVVEEAPSYAPGHAALAEALILSREFGVRNDAEAFGRARAAARTAVRLSPDLASGERLLGFIAYWADADFREAREHFLRAIELDPDEALGHFWYGNILSDRGEHREALQALDRARMAQPGSLAIRTDWAWARWAAGDPGGVAALEAIARRHPDFAVAQDCLAIIAMLENDIDGFVKHSALYAQSRRDPRLIADAAALRRAEPGRVLEVALAQAVTELARRGSGNHIRAVTLASLVGDRAAVVALLNAAEQRRERWGDAPLVQRIRARWTGDAGILALLVKRTPN